MEAEIFYVVQRLGEHLTTHSDLSRFSGPGEKFGASTVVRKIKSTTTAFGNPACASAAANGRSRILGRPCRTRREQAAHHQRAAFYIQIFAHHVLRMRAIQYFLRMRAGQSQTPILELA